MPERVVLLGGTGFLGRELLGAFAAAGATTLSVSRRGGGAGGHALDLATATPGELAGLCAGFGAHTVVNAAGAVWGVTEERMRLLNADLVDRLVAALVPLPGRPRLIQLGSVHEYGPGALGAATDEEWEPAPVTPYGQAKLQASEAVLRAARTVGLNAVVLRVANVCGAGAPHGSLLGKVGAQLADGAEELRFGPLRARRDFVDVRDVAAAVLAAAAAPEDTVRGQVINVGRGEAVPVRELIDRLAALTGRPVSIVEQDAPGGRADVEWQRLDIAKARRLLGWEPRHDLQESLRSLLAAAKSTAEPTDTQLV